MNTHFQNYCVKLKELHELIANDNSESEEADAIREKMSIYYKYLTLQEVVYTEFLSESLYALHQK